jgi:hypothetical protein
MNERGVFLEGVLHVHDRGQGLVVHLDKLEGVLRRVAVARQDHGHDVAHVADLVRDDGREERGLLLLGDDRRARHAAGPVLGEVGPVKAATTPGLSSAAETSSFVTFARAKGLLSMDMWTMPGSLILSVQLALPVTRFGSSLRGIPFPM